MFEIRDPDLPIRYTTFGSTIKPNGVICQNCVWSCAKEHMYSSLRMRKIMSALNAAVNLLPPSFSATGFPVNRFKFWQFDGIYGNF